MSPLLHLTISHACSGSKETDEKEKEPLILNYSYFVPERADKMSAPAQRMALPPKETK